MFKRILIILAVLFIMGGLLVRDASAGPPWPAEVVQIREGDMCYFTWMDKDFNVIYLTAPGMWVNQYINGVSQWNCHTTLDFTDPNLATFDQMCWFMEDVLGWKDYCRGDGSFVWTESSQPVPLSCYSYGDIPAFKATYVASPNGNININCHFNYEP